jgi:hypothetical protein
MKLLQAATGAAAVGLILVGGGIAVAGSLDHPPIDIDHPAGNGGHPAGSHVIGKLEREGGPIGPGGKQPPAVPLSGTVVFSRRGHLAVRVHAGKAGRFSVRLEPGRYTVWGRVEGLPVCRLARGLKVTADRTRHIVVACIVP